METDKSMHDGSPLGNGHVSAELYGNLAICPEEKCPSRGRHWKCYQACFAKCLTYLQRNNIENPKHGPDSGLVKITSG